MNIRQKCTVAIATSLVISAALNLGVLGIFVFPTFIKLEKQSALSDLGRATAALEAQISEIEKFNRDYSKWDDTYRFVKGENGLYVQDNLYASGIQNISMNLIAIVDRTGAPIYEGVYEVGAEEAAPAGPLALSMIDPGRRLLAQFNNDRRAGILMTARGPLLVAAYPVLQSGGEGPFAGTFVMGRLMDEGRVARLNELTHVTFDLLEAVPETLDASARTALRTLLTGENMVTDNAADGSLAVFGLLRDMHNKPALLVRATIDRRITQTGLNALLWALAGMVVAGMIVMAVIQALLQGLLVAPIARLSRHLLAVGSSGDLSQRLDSKRTDEIGMLSREFDGLMQRLAETRTRLLEQSYSAGIAEMASGVLHNIRNQLTPLSLRLERLQQTLGAPPDNKLARAIEEMKSPSADPVRKQKMLQFIELSCRHGDDRQAELLNELKSIAQDFVRIEHVLRDLDQFSRRSTSTSAIRLIDVVRETVSMLPKYPDIEVMIRIDPGMEDCPPVASEPIVVKHVVQNLLVNAIESIIASGKARGTIHIRTIDSAQNGRPCIDLQIQDEGMGIPPDKIEAIFASNFSTKDGKRRGAGLHWCANSILALGGKIYAESPGPWKGATMHLIMPVATSETRVAA